MLTLREKLYTQRLYCDGGTGSVLQSKGLRGGELPERWNLTRPDDITDLARSYFTAGSDIVNSNTFGANRLHYPDPEELTQIIRAGVRHVREGMRLAGRDDGFVALDIGPTGRLLKPMGDLDFEEAVDIFAEVVRAGISEKPDLILIETMSDSLEAKAAVLAAKENADLPVFVTCVFDEKGKMLTGGTVDTMVAMLESLRVDAIGLNCSLGPRQLLPIARDFVGKASIPVICNPNAGLPRSENGTTVYDLSADEFASLMKEIAACGVQILGGCCGTTPEYIRKTIEQTGDIPYSRPVSKKRCVISSFSRTVDIGKGEPVLIGERINPTGKKRFKEALRDADYDYILQQGLDQEEAGAHVLDVNVGLPEIDEPRMMTEVISRLQGILALPLQIDTTNPAALEKALRIYNGKPLVNSVNGKQESLDTVLPLVARYGGVVVGLTLDEEGIPQTARGRLEIARRILETALSYGIPREDIVIDALAMTISMDTASALVTLETLALIRDELHLPTILGVSNISFGLPQREIINASFFTLALREGLSCAIMNPNSTAMMAAYRAFLALNDLDGNCMRYIEAYNDKADLGFGLLPKAARMPASGSSATAMPGNSGAVMPGNADMAMPGTAGSAESGAAGSVMPGNAEKTVPGTSGTTESGAAGSVMPGITGSGTTASSPSPILSGRPSPLMDAIRHGMSERAGNEAARQIAQGADPLAIVNSQIIPA
ncbi:MAG: homocysteine S-methyltransferase family protein, partial [Blautia sp.]|nr:homocysteine S-methyltransferase family protein [Blautia sp.]